MRWWPWRRPEPELPKPDPLDRDLSDQARRTEALIARLDRALSNGRRRE